MRDRSPAAPVDAALREAFEAIEIQPVPRALSALVEALSAEEFEEDAAA